ncbi:hypothetical protein NDI45_30225, partial [Leptolyngbya sp. GB1-A1]
ADSFEWLDSAFEHRVCSYLYANNFSPNPALSFLAGLIWIASMDLWFTWAEELMHLKPQKCRFFRQGLRAMSLIHSVL